MGKQVSIWKICMQYGDNLRWSPGLSLRSLDNLADQTKLFLLCNAELF